MPVWVIIGANRGIGLEFATQLSAESGNTIIATTRSLSSHLSDLEGLKSKNENFHILECDTSNLDSISTFAKQATDVLGKDNKIDYLVNNAGINSVPTETSLSLSAAGLQEHITTNVLGPAKTTEYLLGHLQKGAVIMNISSELGSVAQAIQKHEAHSTTYSISKAALNILTAHQSIQLKERGVIVICMHPGWVKTRMGGDGATLEKEESVRGMLMVLRGVTEKDTGKFYNYSGIEMPW